MRYEGRRKLSKKIASIHQRYLDFVRDASIPVLQKMWGYKRIEDVMQTKKLSLEFYLLEAIRCYRGVAYEALDFDSLHESEQKFILDSVLIFSNLFGPVGAGDVLPFYKLKQGEGFGGFVTKDLYECKELDLMLQGECIVDLRAGFYQKLYAIKTHYYVFEFLKNQKPLSHYAKYYRGVVLREIAKQGGIEHIKEKLEEMGVRHLANKEVKNQTKMIFVV